MSWFKRCDPPAIWRFTIHKLPQFSPWTHWNHRDKLSERKGPGVYVLGRFEEGAPNIADPVDERVLLVAEAHSQTLSDRWYQFQRCAFYGASGHSGGRTFYKLFTNGPDSAVPGWLFVAAAGVPVGEDAERYTKQLKGQLLELYEERHGSFPMCNTNGPAGAEPISSAPTIEPSEPSPSLPPVEPIRIFSKWISWSDRKGIPGVEFAGVYALARFENQPPAEVDILHQGVVYIGETCENSILGRLSQFNRSAFAGKDGHSGGWSYRSRFADAGESLYVSVCPVEDLAEPFRSAFIRWAERQSLWDYVKRWGRRPVCNSK